MEMISYTVVASKIPSTFSNPHESEREMAYVAVISLKNTIHHFLNSSRISVSPSSREILESADAEATSLLQSLKRLDDRDGDGWRGGKRIDALDGRIREAVHKMEDVLEFHASDQHQYYGGDVIPIDLEQGREDLLSLYETVKKMEEEYVKELEKEDDDDDDDDEEEEDDDDDDEEEEDEGVWSSSSIDFGVEMVGDSDEYDKIKDGLLMPMRPDDFVVYPIVGEVGSGRTVLAKGVFDDLRELFDCVAWVSVGPNYHYNDILMQIIVQMDVAAAGWGLGDDVVEVCVNASLNSRRYMIVLDDVQDQKILDCILRFLPVQNNGSLLMFTTALYELADIRYGYGYIFIRKNICSISTCLLIVTGYLRESAPADVEEAVLKIAMNIRGRQLHLMMAMCSLWKADTTTAYLNELAADKNNPIFVIDDELSEVCKIKEEMKQLYDSLVDRYYKVFLGSVMESFDYSEQFLREEVKTQIFPKRFFPKLKIISFYGMAGIGKSTLVEKIFTDPSVIHNTDHRAWITLGPKYHSEEILVDILAKIYPHIHKRHMIEDAELVKDLCAELSLENCLIVLDDVWNQKPLYYLRNLFVLIKGKVLITTRLREVAKFEPSDEVYEVRLLNVEESWCLFCRKVFDNGLCPPKLEKVGKKISENCEGLPLLILTVADLLSKVERTPEYWNKVAEKKNSLFADAQMKISKILLPSYTSLPQRLKALFLYMGVFPESYQIPFSKLNHLLNAERFLAQDSWQRAEDFVAECFSELESRSLVMLWEMGSNLRAKTYRLHSVFWYLATTEASKSTFFQVLNGHSDYPIQDIKCHRRLCIHNSILLSIKDVCISITSVSSAHSLLCTGPPHIYQVPIYFGLRLLRVMDALTIRLYEFQNELVKLVHLRYLALTCNGKLPASISKLWSLQYLIVGQHLNIIKSCEDTLYLPIEIWDLKELRHLQIMGGRLPNPERGATLPNLVALLDVSAQSCTKRVLKRIPNVKKLGIQIELDPGSGGNAFNCLNRIWRLRKLESLNCVVTNPELRSKVGTPPAPLSMFPAGLKKLSLSGLCYPWEYMSIIGKLENLEVLKLRCYAFQGPMWDTIQYGSFFRLKFLSIDDTDLEHWGLNFLSLVGLKHLSLKHCYKLKKLPEHFLKVENIEIVDCNPFVVTWANQMKEMALGNPYYSTLLQVQSSWETY